MKHHVKEFELILDPAAERKIWCWTVASKIEISGLGVLESSRGHLAIPNKVWLPSQAGSFGHTELDDDAVAELQVKCAKAGQRLGFHFHSHGRMEAFFSGLDDLNFSRLSKFGTPFVAAVFNVHGQVQWRVCTSNQTLIEWKSVIEGEDPSKDELAAAAAEVKLAVREDSWLADLPKWFGGPQRTSRRRFSE